jgi:PleD family two-component response regulator
VVRIETVFCLINLTSELSLVLPDSVLDMIGITSDTRLTPFKFNRECEPMRILVAENDVPLADFLCQKLQAEQFTVELIPGTREAEHLVAERPCDLALLDLALPYAAGIETLRKNRSCPWFFLLLWKM